MLDPFLVQPIFRNRVWGGDRLGPWLAPTSTSSDPYQQCRSRSAVGEAWLIADLPATILDGRTPIASGEDAGLTLHDLMQNPVQRRALMGRALSQGGLENAGFPLLLKILDAGQNLSVQVHPDLNYSTLHPHSHMKSEMWFVLDANPGALIYRGIRPDITREQCERHIQQDTLLEIMVTHPARRGDCFWLPSGICHALGAGVLVAEVQTPSDTTFRMWDWGRNDPARPLDLAAAMECLLLGEEQNLANLDRARTPNVVHSDSIAIEGLVRTEWFDVERWSVKSNTPLRHDCIGVPVVWTILDGQFHADSLPHPLHRGSTLILPANHSGLQGRAGTEGTEILVTTLPDPLKSSTEFGGVRIA